MPCKCFTCMIHRDNTIPAQYKLLMECIYYAACAAEERYMLGVLKDAGFKTGHLTDPGIEGEMAATEANFEFDCYAIQELLPKLDTDYARLVNAIYKDKE